jgi:hypothetical protein
MMTRGKMYGLKLTFREHQEFLGYWHNTQKKQYTGTGTAAAPTTTTTAGKKRL